MGQHDGQSVDGTPAPPAPASASPQVVTVASGKRPALWAGVGLVGVGVLLLVSQFVPNMELWRWWPLVLVAVGIRQGLGPRRGHWSVRHLGEALVTISFGLVLLGQMLGVLPWDVWLRILKLWPVMFISLGLEIIGKAMRIEPLRLLGSLVVVAALACGALVMTPQTGWGWPPVVTTAEGERFEYVEPHDGAVVEGAAEISGAVGRLSVAAGDDLVRAVGDSPHAPVFDVSVQGDQARVEVTAGEGVRTPMTPTSGLEVALDRSVDWDIVVKAGVSDYEVDVRELGVTSLALESGVSSGVVTLGRPDAAGARRAVPVEVDTGVSAVVVRVPHGESARVTIDEGLSMIDPQGEWARGRAGGGRTYESDGFSDRGAYWDIQIDSGVGSITLEYY